MYLCQIADTSLKDKTYCRNTTYRFLVKKTKQSSKHPAVLQEFAYTHRTIFLCLPESYQEMLGYNPCCFSLFILTKRATKKDSISIYDKNISIADLTANAPSHFLTLMLNSSELLTVIIWEELEDSSEKCWSAAFPTAGTARKQREMIVYTLQYHCIVCYVQTMITFDRYHKRFCSTIGLCA